MFKNISVYFPQHSVDIFYYSIKIKIAERKNICLENYNNEYLIRLLGGLDEITTRESQDN